jgi:hypothetical protein
MLTSQISKNSLLYTMTTYQSKTLPENFQKMSFFVYITLIVLIVSGLNFGFRENNIHNSLPFSWMGTYHGELHFEGTKNDYKIMMKLQLMPAEMGYHFHITYIDSSGTADMRKYKLLPDNTNGKFILDENNGIKLSMSKLGNELYSQYLVEDNLLSVSYSFSDTSCLFQVFTGSFSQQTASGGTNNTPKVISYPVGYSQKALLKKVDL